MLGLGMEKPLQAPEPAKPEPIMPPLAEEEEASAPPPLTEPELREPVKQYAIKMEETPPERSGGFRPQPFGKYLQGLARTVALETWQFLKSPIFLRNLAGLAGTILLLFLLTNWILRLYTRHGQSLQVPNYVGMDLEDALRKARKQDFKIVVTDSFFDSNQIPNTIYQQDPKSLQRAKEGRTIYVSKYRVPCAEAVQFILAAGGLAVMAHPYLYEAGNLNRIDDIVLKLKEVGVEAIEVYHPEHSPKQVARYEQLAAKYGLAMTGGTDFHGRLKPDIQMGTGKGDLSIPYSLYATLVERCRAKPCASPVATGN